MLGYSIFSRNVFEAGSVELHAGDQFKIDDAASPALGFVVADERPALTAAYQVAARKASIIGGTLYPVSLLNRILNDHLFQGISVFFGMLVVVATLLTFLLSWRYFYREAVKGEAQEENAA